MHADYFAEHSDDAVGTNAPRHIDRQTFAGKLIDDRQAFQLLTVGTGIEHKVVGPHVIGSESRQWARPTDRYPSPWPLSGHLKPCIAPDSMDTVALITWALPFQEYLARIIIHRA